jgi:hypothetical protein
MEIKINNSRWIKTQKVISVSRDGEFIAQGFINIPKKELIISSICTSLLGEKTYKQMADEITEKIINKIQYNECINSI